MTGHFTSYETRPNRELEHKPTAPIRNVFSRRGAV
jgi:hypothetical protein